MGDLPRGAPRLARGRAGRVRGVVRRLGGRARAALALAVDRRAVHARRPERRRGVGVVSGAQADDHVELISMWVAPDHRGTGLADRLIEQVAAWAASNGHDTFLMVRDDNERASKAYEKCGFVDLGVPVDWPADAPRERRMRRARA